MRLIVEMRLDEFNHAGETRPIEIAATANRMAPAETDREGAGVETPQKHVSLDVAERDGLADRRTKTRGYGRKRGSLQP